MGIQANFLVSGGGSPSLPLRQSFHRSLDIYLPYNFSYHYEAGFPIVRGALGIPHLTIFFKPSPTKIDAPMGHPYYKWSPPHLKTTPPLKQETPFMKWFLEYAHPMFWLKPPPQSNFDVPPPSQWGGGVQHPPMFATPVGNPVKRSIFLLWLYIF